MADPRQLRVLLAVNDKAALTILGSFFALHGWQSRPVPLTEIVEFVRAYDPAMVVVEAASSTSAIKSTIGALRANFPQLPIVALSDGSPESAFAAAQSGASELLVGALNSSHLSSVLGPLVKKAAERRRAEQEMESRGNVAPAEEARIADDVLSAQAQGEQWLSDFPELLSATPRMGEIRDTINKVAATSATVLVRGESGVGKEIVARMIYALSDRRGRSFVKVNCAAIPHDLLESELFGYEQGAFTGATRSKPGKFELADDGTLFLDEIGELHPLLQAKLLHVLQDGEFSRLGAKRDIAVDVRVICATNKDLEARVRDGLFREDLFYRINVITVEVPPLRERREEIPLLLDYFLEKYAAVYHRKAAPLSQEVVDRLVEYSWPGNIRELENLCKRYVIVGGARQIVQELEERSGRSRVTEVTGSTLSPAVADVVTEAANAARLAPLPEDSGSRKPMGKSLLEIGHEAAWAAEKQAIEQMLRETRWNRKEAARRLQVSYKALLNKISQMEQDAKLVSGHSGEGNVS